MEISKTQERAYPKSVLEWLHSDHRGWFIISCAIAYALITIISRLWLNDTTSRAFGLVSTVCETALDLLAIALCLRLSAIVLGSKKLQATLILGFGAAAIGDLIYGVCINVLGLPDSRGSWIELAYNVPFNIFLACSAIFLISSLTTRRQCSRVRVGLIVGLCFMLLTYFYGRYGHWGVVSTQTTILTALALASQSGMLVGAIALFLFGTSLPSQLIGGGFLTIVATNLLLQYLEFTGRLSRALPFEAFWPLGLGAICYGLGSRVLVSGNPLRRIGFDFKNTRAQSLLLMLALVGTVPLLWHSFFVSSEINKSGNLWIHSLVIVIFVCVVVFPLAIVYRHLAVILTMKVLAHMDQPKPALHNLLHFDEDLFAIGTRIFSKISDIERERIERQALVATGLLAAQVAHDIRSPLAALDSVLNDIPQLPEDQRVIIRGAVGRIRDIANNLIEKNRELEITAKMIPGLESRTPTVEVPSVQLLSSLIDSLISEKRLQFRSRIGIEIYDKLDAESYGLFAKIQPAEFKRVLSNLIDNSVEAISEKGKVTVSLTSIDCNVMIRVEDNGQGIPATLLTKLGRRGESYGKINGSGLGLYYAKACVESWQGGFGIESTVGTGTIVTLSLPQAPTPNWFVSELALSINHPVVILDDDTSIHHIWQGRFNDLLSKNESLSPEIIPDKLKVKALHFSVPQELRDWVKKSSIKAKETLYLLDYELLGYHETGLSLAEELDIADRTILVTSRYEEHAILEGCRKLKIRMIPKGLAGLVPIQVAMPEKTDYRSEVSALVRLDAVLIDDDALARMTWNLSAQKSAKKFKAYSTVTEFLKECALIDRQTPVYVDAQLGQSARGEEESLRIHALGFKEIYLATGHEASAFDGLKHLRGVVGKEPPWRT